MKETTEIFGDYVLLEKLAESHRSVVFRAKQKESSESVILKILKKDFSSALDIARLKQETKLVQNLFSSGIIHNLGISQYEGSVALILEDANGISLKEYLNGKPLELLDFLLIAIQLSDTLSAIHSQNIVHRDIKPQNIIVTKKKGKIQSAKITDFGISTILNDEIREIYHPNTIEGTLPYISPEQTGRMNLSVDYRTDLYSLGITFYETLTGRLPFSSKDPLDLIYSHIAKEPTPIHEINNSVPTSISEIVKKLLSKSPEDRYQSAYGLKNEFDYILEHVKKNEVIPEFKPGFLDVSDRFVLPQKIFGREHEINELMQNFSEVTKGQTRVMLVSGSPGIGKSRLVNEIHKPIVKARGYFISGKYDQLRKDVPFSSILQAFQSLVRQVLSESEERIENWKVKILDAVGENIEVLFRVIPELEFIVGKQPPVIELSPEESQNRFNFTFVNFVKTFSKSSNPLTLFLDDMQWADQPSLHLIRTMMFDRGLSNFFLVLSFRDNEVKSSHPFMILVDELKKQRVKIHQIHLNALDTEKVIEFLEHLTGKNTFRIKEIASLLFEKTRGNPFFLNQFIKSMYEEKSIRFVAEKGWDWDLSKIQSKEATANVIELMADKILRLPLQTQELLKLCSCIGNRFEVDRLVQVYEDSLDNTLDLLNQATNEGLVYSTGDTYKFLHDRIQEAAYSLLTKDEKENLHKKIGQLILKNSTEAEIFDKIFYIADQLNHSSEKFSSEEERQELIEINYRAGKKALTTAAYESAYHYFMTGLTLLKPDDDTWKNQYRLTHDLYVFAAEASYLCLKYAQMEELSEIILKNSNGISDKIRIYEIKIKTLVAKHDLKGAVNTGLETLRELGVSFPKNPGQIHALVALVKAKIRLVAKKNNLTGLDLLDDEKILSAIRIISNINSPAYWAKPDLLPLLILKVVNLSLKKGNSGYSPYNYAGLGLIFVSLGFFTFANEIGQEAIRLVEKLNALEQKPRTYFVYYTFIKPWVSHIRSTLLPLADCYKNSLQVGDIEFASHSALVYSYYSFLSGVDLEESKKEIEKYIDAANELKQETDLYVIANYRQIISILSGKEIFSGQVHGRFFDEDKQLKRYLEQKDKTSLFHLYLNGLTLNYLFGKFDKAVEYGDKNQKNLEGGLSVFALEVFFFYDSLARLALIKENPSIVNRSRLLKVTKKNLKNLKNCSKFAPMNFLHKAKLVEAEISVLTGKIESTIFLFEEAIHASKENLFIQDEALSYELAGKFYLKLNLIDSAKIYLSMARNCYNKWGASGILDRFDSLYSATIPKYDRENSQITFSSDSTASQSFSSNLDFSTILKFSHVLSSEIDLNVLLEKILIMSMENAGAQKGHLILEEKGKLFIEASGHSGKDITILKSIPVEGSNQIPISVVNYSWKTKDTIILSDACKTGIFIQDPYIAENSIRSIICTPILYKRRMSGILYLENNLTSNAFTPERIELLSILSSQAAISIDNARLISQRQDSAKFEKEMEITAKIQTSLIPSEPKSKGYEISSYMKPAESVGGDYYDLINGKEKDWLVVGDVSGHGILSGLVMMMVQTSIHLLLSKDEKFSPADMLKILITGIEENIRKITRQQYKYMTITILNFDDNGLFTYSGQHQDILLYRKETKIVERIETEGIWIGLGNLAEDKDKLIQNKNFQMRAGDVLMLYTDGITEGVYKDGKEFGVEGLVEILRTNGENMADRLRDEILLKVEELHTSDDISFLIMKKL